MKVVSFMGRWRDELAAALAPGIVLEGVDPHATDPGALARALADAQVLISTEFGPALAPLCKSLELVVCPAAGTEGIDRSALPPRVTVVNGIGHEAPMAEYVIGSIVALRQRFASADAALRQGRWAYGFFGSGAFVDELVGSSLGLIGFGRIGTEVARRAAAFGMRCAAVTMRPDKTVEQNLLAEPLGDLRASGDVDRLVARSDHVVIACELSPVTRGLLDRRRIALMRPGAVLVNVARGPIVDEHALYDALAERRIFGAALDVWYRYPERSGDQVAPGDLPFAALDNVLMTPHSSGWTLGMAHRKLVHLAGLINDWSRRERR